MTAKYEANSGILEMALPGASEGQKTICVFLCIADLHLSPSLPLYLKVNVNVQCALDGWLHILILLSLSVDSKYIDILQKFMKIFL